MVSRRSNFKLFDGVRYLTSIFRADEWDPICMSPSSGSRIFTWPIRIENYGPRPSNLRLAPKSCGAYFVTDDFTTMPEASPELVSGLPIWATVSRDRRMSMIGRRCDVVKTVERSLDFHYGKTPTTKRLRAKSRIKYASTLDTRLARDAHRLPHLDLRISRHSAQQSSTLLNGVRLWYHTP